MDENNAGGVAIEATERLQAAAERLEKTVAWLEERQAAMTGDVARIVATVDATADTRQRELERKLEEAEQQIAELKAQAAASDKRPQDNSDGDDAVAGQAGHRQRGRPGGRLAGCCADRVEPGAAGCSEGAAGPERRPGLSATAIEAQTWLEQQISPLRCVRSR